MDTYMHKTMVSVASLEKIEIIRSQEFMPSEVRLKFLKKMIILGPKTAILGPQFCRILVLGPHFWWSGGGPGPLAPPWIRPCSINIKCNLPNPPPRNINTDSMLGSLSMGNLQEAAFKGHICNT